MVKIERKDTEKTALAIESLAKEKGRCNTDEVIDALMEIFHSKCYICESKKPNEIEVEHLTPHNGDKNLKFDWNNLFLACGRCNHIKGDKYTPILDCTKVEVDEIIAFRKIGYFGTDEFLQFEPISDFPNNEEIQMTCELLQRIHYGNTPQEKVGAKMLRHSIRQELTNFKNYVRDYLESTGEDKKDLFVKICSQLKSNSQFAAFKRWIVRDNDNCKDFLDCWKE
jgi:uncharacterized protein (TIGR02646 family)